MKQLFLDIDTQIDFLFPAGALYVPGAEKLLAAIARLNRHAVQQGIPLISTMCAHAEDDPEFREWPAHCVVGTAGQQKPAALLHGQTMIEKQQLDLFSNPKTRDFLSQFDTEEYVVYGVATEHCVRLAAMGLLETGKRVTVLRDAIQHIDSGAAENFYSDLLARGGELRTGSI